MVTQLLRAMTKRGLNSNASNTSSHTRFASPPIRGKRGERREQRKRASKLHKLSASPHPPPAAASSRCSGYCWWGREEGRSGAVFFLPQEEGGRARRSERRLQRAPVVRSSSGDAKRRDADSNGSDGARRGGDALGAGREGKGRRRIVDVVKLQLSYTPASSPRLPPRSLSHSWPVCLRRLQHGRMDYKPTDCGNCFL